MSSSDEAGNEKATSPKRGSGSRKKKHRTASLSSEVQQGSEFASGKPQILPPHLVGAFRHLLEVPVNLFVDVSKVNKKGKHQNRLMIVIGDQLYSCADNGSIKRSLSVASISELHIHRNPYQIALKVPDEYDMLVEVKAEEQLDEVKNVLQAVHDKLHANSRQLLTLVDHEEPIKHSEFILEKPKDYERAGTAKISWIDSRQGVHFDPFADSTTAQAGKADGLIVTDRATGLNGDGKTKASHGRSSSRRRRESDQLTSPMLVDYPCGLAGGTENECWDDQEESFRNAQPPSANRRGSRSGASRVTIVVDGDDAPIDAVPPLLAGDSTEPPPEAVQPLEQPMEVSAGEVGTSETVAPAPECDPPPPSETPASAPSSEPTAALPEKTKPSAVSEVEIRRLVQAKVKDLSEELVEANGSLETVIAMLVQERRRHGEERENWEVLLAAEKQNVMVLRQCVDELRTQVDRLSIQNVQLRHSVIHRRPE